MNTERVNHIFLEDSIDTDTILDSEYYNIINEWVINSYNWVSIGVNLVATEARSPLRKKWADFSTIFESFSVIFRDF
jgi:hypothetical protein